ncbi:AAA family ATPase [Pseudomonas sp. MWU13-3659]|uniref:AAA family ATPase n=1 Tax=Pseudomonas sp. MWU13-3659 TaxID=2986964 RepID=UPI0020753257|nr:AAA family ATPase [Pseudomonas sp. MWU13-3659]
MKICYLWAKEFKGLTRHGVNLDSTFEYQYDSVENRLSRTEKAPLPADFFGESIENITGILGVNGAGKTNTLDLICRVLKSSDSVPCEFLVIYQERGSVHCISSTASTPEADFEIIHQTNDAQLKALKVVYFSNVFDKNYLDLGDEVLDVSVNNKNNPRTLARQRGNEESEFINDLTFITSSEFKALALEPPPGIEVKLDRTLSFPDIDNAAPPEFHGLINFLRSARRAKSLDKLKAAVHVIKISFLATLSINFREYGELPAVIKPIIAAHPADANGVDALISALTKHYFSSDRSAHWNKQFLMSDLLGTLEILHNLFLDWHFAPDNSASKTRHNFTLSYIPEATEIYRYFGCILQSVRYSAVSWKGISSGQKAYMNMFGTIWNCLQRGQHAQRGSTTLVCVDEGDLYLHPQWQVEFVEKLITTLPTLSGGTVQIIVTTHSPILISDLPHQCVETLSAGQMPARLKTFGANIHEIYRSAFGLTGQRTGNLSAKYVRTILEILDKPMLTESDKLELTRARSIIDDTLILHHVDQTLGQS